MSMDMGELHESLGELKTTTRELLVALGNIILGGSSNYIKTPFYSL
jgi:hypothetical protein